MKKIIYLIPLILFLTGCNSYTELNDLGIILEIGIEHNDAYKMYANVINSIDNDFNINLKTINVTGNNISELMNNLSTNLNKKIYLSHLNLLIINDSIKTFEIKELINFFQNNPDARNDFLIVSNNNIEELLKGTNFQEINDLIKINKESSKTVYTTMFDIINNYYLNKSIFISNIEYSDNIKLNGLKKISNNKIEFINQDEVIYINYLLNNISKGEYTLECDYNKYINIEILESTTSNIKNQILITNELKIDKNDCKLNNKEIDKLYTNKLESNLNKLTNKKINIKNTIRSYYENN